MKYIKIAVIIFGLLFLCGHLAFSQEDQPEIKIEFTKINDHIYKLTGFDNFDINVVASVGPDGILLVDAGTENMGKLLPGALKKISDADVKYLINTHFHNDHTGGNKYFKDKATIIGHSNILERMTGKYFALGPLPQEGIPNRTFDDTLTLHFNGEDVIMKHLPGGHTDTDILVYFSDSKILCVGDMVCPGNFPYVDVPNGGSVDNYALYIKYIITHYPDDVIIIAGHRHILHNIELNEYFKTLNTTINIIRKQIALGKTVEEMQQAEILADYAEWGEWPLISANNWIHWVHESLTHEDSPPPVSIAKPLTEIIMQEGIESAVAHYRDLKKNRPDEFGFGANQLNMLGYQLMFRDMLDEAVEIFKLNIEAYPEWSNVYDSMGEAYMNRGDKELAIKNYEKSLELNPENENARQMLKQLRGE